MLTFKINSEQFECSNVFFTSDTHFSEQRTLELSRRPFEDTKEMNQTLVDNWNKRVGKNDVVIHLGDFGESKSIRKQLNGRIILLFGNYDRADKELLPYLCDSDKVYSKEFSIILHINREKWELVHEPENRVTDLFYLFGHIHKTQQVKPNGLNVGVDCHNFTPLSLEDILFYKEAVEKHYDNNVFDIF